MTRVAAIDCGTNSLRLLVADVDAAGLCEVRRTMRIVRLGQGVDRTGRLAPEALERTARVLDEYAAEISELRAERVRMVATSATRDAENRSEFVALVESRLGVRPDVVTGQEEAALSFTGAVRGLPEPPDPPVLVVDIGGGSTEFVYGTSTADSPCARSVNIGCVRLFERHFAADPPTREQVDAAVRDIEIALDLAAESVPIDTARTLVCVAGTATTVAGLALGLPEYDPRRLHGARVNSADVDRVASMLLRQTVAERRELPVMHPGRADVIAAGALILRCVVGRAATGSYVASETDILDGIALALA